jgi:hypothetical protein
MSPKTSEKSFFKTLEFKLILVLSFLVIIGGLLLGGFWWYQNSSYQAYWRVSDGIVNRNYQEFYDQVDADKVMANFPKNPYPELVFVPQNIDNLKQYLEVFLANSKADKLPKNQWEVFNNPDFKQVGDTYTLEVFQASQISSLNKFKFTFEKVGSNWKVTKIEFFFDPGNRSLSDLISEAQQAMQNQPKFEPEKTVEKGQSTTIRDFQVQVVSSQIVDSLDAFPTDDLGTPTSSTKIKITPRSNQTKLLKIQYSQENQSDQSNGATDLTRNFKLKLINGELLDPVKNISDTTGGQKIEGVSKYVEASANSAITRIVVFEVPNNFDQTTSVLFLPALDKGDSDISFKLN